MLLPPRLRDTPRLQTLGEHAQTELALPPHFGPTPAIWAGMAALGLLLGVFVAALPPFAGLAAVVAVVLGARTFVQPRLGFLGFCAVVALLPFGVLPIKIGASPTFLDAIIGTLTLVWCLRLLSPSAEDERAHRAATLRGLAWAVSIVLLLWIAAAFISFVVGAGFSSLHSDVVRNFLEIILATFFFVVTLQMVREAATVRQIVSAIVVCGGIEAALGISFYFLPNTLATRLLSALHVVGYPTGLDVLRFRVDFTHVERAISTSVDPNVLGGLLVVTTSISLSQLFARQPVVRRLVSGPAASAMLCCLLLTYSRGAWISLGVAILFMALWQYRSLLVLFAIALMIFVQLPVSQSFTTQLESGVQVQDQAAGMRVGEIKDSLRLIGRYPVFGVGFGSAPDSDLYVGVSNIYLLVGEQTGIVGLTLFLVAIGLYLLALLAALPRVRDPALRSIVTGLFGACIGALVSGLFDRYFFSYPHDVALFWFLPALALATVLIDRRDSGSARQAA